MEVNLYTMNKVKKMIIKKTKGHEHKRKRYVYDKMRKFLHSVLNKAG